MMKQRTGQLLTKIREMYLTCLNPNSKTNLTIHVVTFFLSVCTLSQYSPFAGGCHYRLTFVYNRKTHCLACKVKRITNNECFFSRMTKGICPVILARHKKFQESVWFAIYYFLHVHPCLKFCDFMPEPERRHLTGLLD